MYISYFYKIVHFVRITTKFGSKELDIYNYTYDFSKLTYISEINELASRPKPLTAGVPESAGPACQWHKIEDRHGSVEVR